MFRQNQALEMEVAIVHRQIIENCPASFFQVHAGSDPIFRGPAFVPSSINRRSPKGEIVPRLAGGLFVERFQRLRIGAFRNHVRLADVAQADRDLIGSNEETEFEKDRDFRKDALTLAHREAHIGSPPAILFKRYRVRLSFRASVDSPATKHFTRLAGAPRYGTNPVWSREANRSDRS